MTTELIGSESDYKLHRILSINAGAVNQSSEINIIRTMAASWQVVWAAMVGVAVVELQVSHDGINWDTVQGSSLTTSGASGSGGGQKQNMPGCKARLAVTSAATSGTIDLFFLAKQDDEA